MGGGIGEDVLSWEEVELGGGIGGVGRRDEERIKWEEEEVGREKHLVLTL